MKIPAARADAFVGRPDPAVRVALVYGPDDGLVRERADALTRAVAGDPSDPFRTMTLGADAVRREPARLMDEAAALSLTGGRRAIRVRDAADTLTDTVKTVVDATATEALVIVEAGDLGPRSSLRRYCESAAAAAAIPCYADDAESLSRLVRTTLDQQGLSASPEAMEFLLANMGSDRIVSRSELEKLVLFKGGPGRVTVEDAMACVGDSGAVSLDDVVFAMADGDAAALDRALSRTDAEGLEPVALLRAAARHLQRLHLAGAAVAAGRPPADAAKALRPPVFFKHIKAFCRQLERWRQEQQVTGTGLAEALAIVTEAELACKTTGVPADLVASRALLDISTMARRGRPRA